MSSDDRDHIRQQRRAERYVYIPPRQCGIASPLIFPLIFQYITLSQVPMKGMIREIACFMPVSPSTEARLTPFCAY